jgi:hypothetical protein
MASNVGEVISIDMRVDVANFVRIIVWLDERKELTRFVPITPVGEAPLVMHVKYEKIPRYYSLCGLIGHVREECGSAKHSPGKVAFGKCLLADTLWNRSHLHPNEYQYQASA